MVHRLFQGYRQETGDEGSLVHMSSWRFAAQTNDKDDVTVIYFDGMSDSLALNSEYLGWFKKKTLSLKCSK